MRGTVLYRASSFVCQHLFEEMPQPVSEYFCALSDEAKSRYIAKITLSGLESDPYAIPDGLWVSQPVSWSDMF